MSEKPTADKPTKTGTTSGAESPTTARELDFDDDNETPATAPENVSSPPPPSKSPKPGVRFSEDATEIPPAKPPRPMDAQQEVLSTLIEAFPNIETGVIKAVWAAAGGDAQKAFDALFGMSDPDAKKKEQEEEEIARANRPRQPPRPPKTQEEIDFELAMKVHREEERRARAYQEARMRENPSLHRERKETGLNPNELNDRDIDWSKELSDIGKNIEEGFRDTRKQIGQWWDNVTKSDNHDADDDDRYDDAGHPSQRRQNFGPSQSDQMYGIRRSTEHRRSADRERYDTDNRVLGDDFEALELRDDEGTPPPKPARPLANPNLFKPTPVSPPQSGPVDEVDALYRNPSPNNQGKTGGKKWQPLTSVAPHPEPDDHDPFSLGDSDDEEAKTKDIKAEDTERLKKAAESKEGVSNPELKEAGRSGSVGQKDAAAEALLKDTK